MLNIASKLMYLYNIKFITIAFVNNLFQFKHKYCCGNRDFDELIELIELELLDDHKLPIKYNDVKRLVRGLNREYQKIDAYLNDCMLFYKE